MSSLTSCFKKAGALLHPEDKASILDRARELKAGGLDNATAQRQALQERVAHVGGLLDGLGTPEVKQGERGAFNPSTHTITLNKDADLSTTVHELGHSFLDTMSHVAVGPKASEGVKTDFGTLLKWFGVKDAAEWHGMSVEQQRPMHEKLAKSFEQYMFEGNAPNPQLQSVFGRIRSWMINVYKHVANIGAELNPEVRGVFDRMLATDEAIKQAEQLRSYAPLFEDAKAMGKGAEAFNAYQALGKEATDAAVEHMQSRSLRDMQWLSNAKSKALKALQRQGDAARKDVAAEVENEVSALPAFQAQEAMKVKGADADIVANAHGFQDGNAMRQAIMEAGDKKDIIQAMTDQRMMQRHGELVDPQSIEVAANEAVHNEARARFMATGLKALTDSPLPANQIAKAAKEVAESTIAGKVVGDLRSDQYLAAEARANKEAIDAAAKDPAKAIEAQRAALLNNRLAKAAMDAQAEVQKGLEFFKKFDKSTVAKAVGGEYMDRINELLSQYDVTNRFNTRSDVEARQNMRDWLKSESDRTGVMPEVSDALLDFTQRRHWKELTVEDFRGLVDAAKSLEHVGRENQFAVVEGKRVEVRSLVDEARANLTELPHTTPVDIQPHLLHAEGLNKINAQWLKFKSGIRGADAALVKMEQMYQWLDRGKKAGLGDTKVGAFQKMFRIAAAAEGTDRSMKADAHAALDRIAESIRDSKVKPGESLDIPALQRKGRGSQWYREELLSAALNFGNKEGRLNLTHPKGNDLNGGALLDAFNKHFTPAEWKFIQGTLNHVNSYWAATEALQKRQTGVAPPKVEAVPFGDIAGGYFPIVRDSFLDTHLETKEARNTAALFENQFSKPTTSKGHTVARTGYIGPIHLSLGTIARHIDQVTHDLAWREAIVDMNKFLAHPEITKEVDEVMGREYRKQFRPWLQAMANDKVFNTSGDSAWESFYRKVRTNATMVGLGFRISTMEIHGLSALSNSIGEVGPVWFAKGAAAFVKDWDGAKQFMFDRSPEMANRMNESDRNVHEMIDQINRNQHALGPVSLTQKSVDGARKYAFYGVQALDMGSAAPTWFAGYLKGMTPEAKGGLGLSESDAVNFANQTVRNAHGGGGVKDLSAVQRDNGVMSMATMFYSFWNHMYNRQRDLAKGYANLPESFRQGTGTKDFAKLLARSWWYFVIPQLIHAALKPTPTSEQSDGEDDLGAMVAHMGKEVGLGFVSGVPVLRDLANAAVNGRDYTITPLEAAGKSIVKAAVDTTKFVRGEETSAHAGKNAAQAVGYAAGLPTGQLSASGTFLWDVYSGDADPQGIKDWYTGIQNGRISP